MNLDDLQVNGIEKFGKFINDLHALVGSEHEFATHSVLPTFAASASSIDHSQDDVNTSPNTKDHLLEAKESNGHSNPDSIASVSLPETDESLTNEIGLSDDAFANHAKDETNDEKDAIIGEMETVNEENEVDGEIDEEEKGDDQVDEEDEEGDEYEEYEEEEYCDDEEFENEMDHMIHNEKVPNAVGALRMSFQGLETTYPPMEEDRKSEVEKLKQFPKKDANPDAFLALQLDAMNGFESQIAADTLVDLVENGVQIIEEEPIQPRPEMTVEPKRVTEHDDEDDDQDMIEVSNENQNIKKFASLSGNKSASTGVAKVTSEPKKRGREPMPESLKKKKKISTFSKTGASSKQVKNKSTDATSIPTVSELLDSSVTVPAQDGQTPGQNLPKAPPIKINFVSGKKTPEKKKPAVSAPPARPAVSAQKTRKRIKVDLVKQSDEKRKLSEKINLLPDISRMGKIPKVSKQNSNVDLKKADAKLTKSIEVKKSSESSVSPKAKKAESESLEVLRQFEESSMLEPERQSSKEKNWHDIDQFLDDFHQNFEVVDSSGPSDHKLPTKNDAEINGKSINHQKDRSSSSSKSHSERSHSNEKGMRFKF